MGRWKRGVRRTTVPEAAIHENGEAGSAEEEIGMAGQGLMAAPTGDAVGAKDGRQL